MRNRFPSYVNFLGYLEIGITDLPEFYKMIHLIWVIDGQPNLSVILKSSKLAFGLWGNAILFFVLIGSIFCVGESRRIHDVTNLRLNSDQTVGVGHLCYHETISKKSERSSAQKSDDVIIQPFDDVTIT